MKDAFGIEWRSSECTLICYDDDIWDDWVKDHSDAKGLRNKPFPYYDELCLIFGKSRGNHKSVEDASDANRALDVYETSENAGRMSRDEQFNFNPVYRSNGKVLENENNESDHEEANDHKGNDMGVDDDSNDDDVLVDDVVGTPTQTSPCVGNKKKGQSSGSWPSGMEALVKIFDTMLKRHEEQFSLLAGLMGREVAAEKAASDKRARLNGELKRIPNLSLQARLRAASVIVSDPAKLDLFYSLSNEERKEWVSMLLSGLI